MFKGRGWFGGGLWKPKNPHSLDHLKYLYNILSKNQIVTEQNKSLLVETLRSIAEILIWGDQNDSTVFDFFLEKNMLSFFLKIMKQKCGRYVCVQLLQTLNILFENIRNETSLYYLLSNNHVNFIIVHKFDFSDEEVMAYYISFLKTLSLKLNNHTIHFFFNEHTHDFPLYTEAIKFFNHSESMVRIAVRTLTLNVYKVDDKSMLKFIRDKTAAPYFSNLVWFIGNHVLELDSCVRNDDDHQSRNRLSDLVAEHLDHLHYLNDILCLQIEALNDVLTDHLLNRLLIPLYVYSLTKRRRHSQIEDDKPHVSSVVSLFLLSQVFLIISHVPLVRQLADIILNRDMSIFSEEYCSRPKYLQGSQTSRPGFIAPPETLEKSLENKISDSRSSRWHKVHDSLSGPASDDSNYSLDQECFEVGENSSLSQEANSKDVPTDDNGYPEEAIEVAAENTGVVFPDSVSAEESNLNITDEEKEKLQAEGIRIPSDQQSQRSFEHLHEEFSLASRPYLEAIFNALECSENDYAALFALCLLYALGHNQGINQELLDAVLMPTDKSETKDWYNVNLVERLIKIISGSCQYNSKVRLATLEMSLILLKQLVFKNGRSFLQDRHLAALEGAREESILLLRNFYKSEEIFLDMFEDEYREMKKKPLNVEYLTMDSNILLPPTGTPLTGIEFYKRFACGDVEKARRAIRVFFLLRDLSLTLRMELEGNLPLTNPQSCVQVGDVLDLNNSDLIACTVIIKDSQKIRRFLVIDVIQLILVEPDSKRLGWGIAKFVGFLQDIEVTGDKDDSRCLHVTIHRPLSSSSSNRVPFLSAKFVFDDHIRCMAAKQRLTKGRIKARQRKMHMIAKLLELPGNIQPCPSPPPHAILSLRHQDTTHRRSGMHRSVSHEPGMWLRSSSSSHKPLFTSGHKVPGFAAMMRREEVRPAKHSSRSDSSERHRRCSGSPSGRHSRSREGSPQTHHSSSSEEIPLEDLSRPQSPRSPGKRKSAPNLPVVRIGLGSPNIHRISPSNGLRHSHNRHLQPEPFLVAYSSADKQIVSVPPPSPKSIRAPPAEKERVYEVVAPKTLRPPDTPPVSLLEPNSDLESIAATCILPPVQTDCLYPHADTASDDEPPPVKSCVTETSFVESPSASDTALQENQISCSVDTEVGSPSNENVEMTDDIPLNDHNTDHCGNITENDKINLNDDVRSCSAVVENTVSDHEDNNTSNCQVATDAQHNELMYDLPSETSMSLPQPQSNARRDSEDPPQGFKAKGAVLNV